jgi:hypothetical protein
VNQLVMDRTVSRTARPRTAPAPSTRRRSATAPTASAPHEVRSMVGIATGVLVILLLAAWSFAQGWGRGPVAGPGQIALDGGIVRVDGVVSAARPQHAMPGMGSDEDPVAEGERRISVDLTLMAGTDAMDFDVERFGLTVDGDDAAHLTHRDVLPGDHLPAGTQLSGTILFDVPADATTATLTYDGAGSTDIVVPPESEQEAGSAPASGSMTDAGHGAQPHGDAPATTTLDETAEAGK